MTWRHRHLQQARFPRRGRLQHSIGLVIHMVTIEEANGTQRAGVVGQRRKLGWGGDDIEAILLGLGHQVDVIRPTRGRRPAAYD